MWQSYTGVPKTCKKVLGGLQEYIIDLFIYKLMC